MPVSQNGYPANNISLTKVYAIPGTERSVRLRDGAAGRLLVWVAAQFHKLVEPIDDGIFDDWGYAERPIRGSTTVLSNHASGTALDLNATKHPQGTSPTANFKPAQIATIHQILAKTEGCVRWGGDYVAPALKDGMHFEIISTENRCAQVYDKLTRETDWIDMADEKDVENALVNALRRALSSGELTGPEGNIFDMLRQLRNSTVNLQTKGQATNDALGALNGKLDQLNNNISALVKVLTPKAPGQ